MMQNTLTHPSDPEVMKSIERLLSTEEGDSLPVATHLATGGLAVLHRVLTAAGRCIVVQAVGIMPHVANQPFRVMFVFDAAGALEKVRWDQLPVGPVTA